MDIIDLWPGSGLWSSKVNDFLQPRRHLLVEPDKRGFGRFLRHLVTTKPCYHYLNLNPYRDSQEINKYVLEPDPSGCDRTGALAKNNTLLILANMPINASKKDHFKPAQWWSTFLESCLGTSGLNSYGAVRVIAMLPSFDARTVIPRAVYDRKRAAILSESLASHMFEVAATHDPASWSTYTGWDLTLDGAAHVAKKSAENNVAIPTGREPPLIPMAPKSPDQGYIPCPYVPRVRTSIHDKLMAQINAVEATYDATAKGLRGRALSKLNFENRGAFELNRQVDAHIVIDELVKRLSRDAADPHLDFKALKPLADKIEELKAAWLDEANRQRDASLRIIESRIDSKRCAVHSNDFDKSLLMWDRRPFEPLTIHDHEHYPGTSKQSIIYFEADANALGVKKLNDANPYNRVSILRTFNAICFTFGSRRDITLGELLHILFPNLSTNDVVKAIPGLATFAFKRLKPDFDNLPKTVHAGPGGQESSEPRDPVQCFQENLDYDLSYVRLRVLSASTLWDIAVEYEKNPNKLEMAQLSHALGGTITEYRAGMVDRRRIH